MEKIIALALLQSPTSWGEALRLLAMGAVVTFPPFAAGVLTRFAPEQGFVSRFVKSFGASKVVDDLIDPISAEAVYPVLSQVQDCWPIHPFGQTGLAIPSLHAVPSPELLSMLS